MIDSIEKRWMSEYGEKEGLAFTEKSLRGPRLSNPEELLGVTKALAKLIFLQTFLAGVNFDVWE